VFYATKEPLAYLPMEIQANWMATLKKETPTKQGIFELVDIKKTQPGSWQEGKLIVLVLDPNGLPMAGVPVAFGYSTASRYLLMPEFLWTPSGAQPGNLPLAHIVPTEGGGQIEMVQGSTVQEGQPGGMTVWIHTPEYSSDSIAGAGALADHTGLYMVFRLRLYQGGQPQPNLHERLTAIEQRLVNIENRL
jgi:hypothetical protein